MATGEFKRFHYKSNRRNENNIKIINKLQWPLQWGTKGMESRKEDNFDDTDICCGEWVNEGLKIFEAHPDTGM